MHFRAFHNAFVIFTLCACLFIIIIFLGGENLSI